MKPTLPATLLHTLADWRKAAAAMESVARFLLER